MYLLSIVIPTFNRCTLLRKTLNQLSGQISPEASNEIELIVSDNASADATGEIMNQWIANNQHIKTSYYRNTSNIGFDRNCLSGANKANGKFVWFMSDDDSLVDGAIDKVYKALKRNGEVVFAFVNYSMLTPGFDEYFPCKFEENLRVSADDLIIKTNFSFSFISSCIFNKKVLCSLDLSKYLNSNWMQLYAVKFCAVKGDSLIIAEPLIKMRREGLQESRNERKSTLQKIDLFMEFHLSFLEYLDTFNESQYSKATLRFIKNSGWADNLNQIVSLKLTSDSYNFSEIKLIYSRMLEHFSHRITFWLIHLPMLFLPKFVAIVYFFFKLKYIKLKKIIKPILVNFKFIK